MTSKRVFLLAVALAAAAAFAIAAGPSSAATYTRHCFAKYPGGADGYFHTGKGEVQIQYPDNCYGHDEPDISPVSTAANSASNVTWTFVLPKDGTTRSVLDLGPTFWAGANLVDNKSLGNQAFEELQFYPDFTLHSQDGSGAEGCGPDGSFNGTHTVGKWTICSPSWAVDPITFNEYAAFNGMVTKAGSTTLPFVMSSGDKITVSYTKGAQTGTPFNIKVTDNTTKTTATTLVLNAGAGKSDPDGPLGPVAGANTIANHLYWSGLAAPLSISWEIGHPNFFTYPAAPQCVQGMFNCYSYNVTNGWLKTTPLKITSAKFNSNTVTPKSWAVGDSYGAWYYDVAYCGVYNNPLGNGFCTFPWYTYNSTANAIEFGGSYAGTASAFNTYKQFGTTYSCNTNGGPGTQYLCATTLVPNPPIP